MMRFPRKTLVRFAAFSAACLALFPSFSRAQNALVGAYSFSGGTPACNVDVAAGANVLLDIRIDVMAGSVASVRFGIQPSQGTWSGSFANVLLSPASCAMSPGTSMGLVILTNTGGALTGVNFDVVPATGHATIELTDCDGYAMTGADHIGSYIDPCELRYLIAGYRPFPADGATDVPLNVTPSWMGPGNLVWLADHPITSYLDTDLMCWPDNWLSDENGAVPAASCNQPLSLAPNTTYYWVIGNANPNACEDCEVLAVSKMYSFTTADGPLLTEPSTWGYVKSLYRK